MLNQVSTMSELAKRDFTPTEFDDWDERSAIMEFDGKINKDVAESRAYRDVLNRRREAKTSKHN